MPLADLGEVNPRDVLTNRFPIDIYALVAVVIRNRPYELIPGQEETGREDRVNCSAVVVLNGPNIKVVDELADVAHDIIVGRQVPHHVVPRVVKSASPDFAW